jgi:hypothetical protein
LVQKLEGKLKIKLPYDLAIPNLSVHSEEIEALSQRYLWSSAYIESSFAAI